MFFQLPREIRDQIYGMVLDSLVDPGEGEHGHIDVPLENFPLPSPYGKAYEQDNNGSSLWTLRYNLPPHSTLISLMSTCKKLHRELLETQRRRRPRRQLVDFARPQWNEAGRFHGLLRVQDQPPTRSYASNAGSHNSSQQQQQQQQGWTASFSWLSMPLRPRRQTMVALSVLIGDGQHLRSSTKNGCATTRPMIRLLIAVLQMMQRNGPTLVDEAVVAKMPMLLMLPHVPLDWVFVEVTHEFYKDMHRVPAEWSWRAEDAELFFDNLKYLLPGLRTAGTLAASSIGRNMWRVEGPHLSWIGRYLMRKSPHQHCEVLDSFHLILESETPSKKVEV